MNTEHLTNLMADHWQTNLNNITSRDLESSWRQAFNTFDRKIAENGTEYEADWHVLSPKTGTGKSQSLALYAAEMSRNDYTAPGILIVVRLIAQADEFAEMINNLAGRGTAVAQHSESKLPRDELSDYAVLVITHAAFTGQARRSDAWDSYMKFGGTRRQLVVIDEAIDILDIARIDADTVTKLCGAIPHFVRTKYPAGFEAVETMKKILTEIRELPNKQTTEARVVLPESKREFMQTFSEGWSGFDELVAIREYMRGDAHQYLLGKRSIDRDAEHRQKRSYDKIFSDLLSIYDSFILHFKTGNTHTLNTATRILPDDGQGCVVLDATADTSPIYECMVKDGGKNVIKHPAITCRSYSNVVLRASFGHAVGRSSLVRSRKGEQPKVKEIGPKLFAALTEEHKLRSDTRCPLEKVLVVCHKAAEPHLAGFDVPFKYDLAHYGALDGRNDWRDYDSVVIFGLDYRHPADAPSQFMALQPEFQINSWFKDSSLRAFRGYLDIRAAIDQGTIVSSVIQAVNRIRTRRVIDTAGNCPESVVYLLLPDDSLGKAVHDQLLIHMPGMQKSQWHFKGARKAPRSKHEAALRVFTESMVPGESWPASKLKQHLSISKSAWERLVPKLRSNTTAIGQHLIELGVAYEITGAGQSQRAGLRKL